MPSLSSASCGSESTQLPVKTMQELVSSLNQAMGDSGLGDDLRTVHQVKQLMHSYVSQSDDWEQHAVYHEGTRYTRNLVDDGNGKYNLLILVWGEGQSSPIHDHAGSHCMMKLLAGELDEQLFAWPRAGGSLELRRTAPLRTNSVAYMHDKIGLHRIANPSAATRAVSLHLYSPPYNMCKTFDESTGKAVQSSCAAQKLTTSVAKESSSSQSFSCSAGFAADLTMAMPQQQGTAITSI
ncbi:hypothetical protein GGF44_001052 [Coemansia sp. RSA 1694]|nr:hypothetical protein GGF42_003446 [Coemansia sp. RSA 2424]KAJ2581853.1 hypothetical protein GGH95_001858 [Coemansia sp. RSA 1836]KAJ2643678.1 hypothetical protein GGF44_001052 [Coemansia sp. RSA 1694]